MTVSKSKYEDPHGDGRCWKYGCTVKEIAMIMQCSENAVWLLLHNSFKKMRQAAKEMQIEGVFK